MPFPADSTGHPSDSHRPSQNDEVRPDGFKSPLQLLNLKFLIKLYYFATFLICNEFYGKKKKPMLEHG